AIVVRKRLGGRREVDVDGRYECAASARVAVALDALRQHPKVGERTGGHPAVVFACRPHDPWSAGPTADHDGRAADGIRPRMQTGVLDLLALEQTTHSRQRVRESAKSAVVV